MLLIQAVTVNRAMETLFIMVFFWSEKKIACGFSQAEDLFTG